MSSKQRERGAAVNPDLVVPEYVVRRASTQEELSSIFEVLWEANHQPYEPFIQLFCPILGIHPADRLTSISEHKARFWANHVSDPSSNWLYAVHSTTAKVVGCAQWQVFEENPFPTGPPRLEAPWWPEKEQREFAECILNQVYKARASWMRRPHLALNWMAVLPTYRSRGVGSLLMDWGVRRADETGSEAWLEGSPMGKPLYEKFGYRALFKIGFNTETKDATDQWRRMEHEMTPTPFYAMWRPPNGDWEGVRMPWELG